MSKTKEEFFIPEICENCVNDCKQELNIIFKKDFENGQSNVFCAKQKKSKKSKKTK